MLNCNLTVRDSNELYVDGIINFDNATGVMQLGCQFIAKLHVININLAQLQHSDSSGLAVISAWISYASNQKKVLKIYNMPKFLYDLSKLSNLEQIFPVVRQNRS